jgi:PAS domain S-box-containing protein
MHDEKEQGASRDDQIFLSAFMASPIGIALEDLEGRPLFANPALCAMLGFSEEEMRRKHCVEFSPSEDAKKDWALFEQLRAGSIKHYKLEKRFIRRDGSLIWGRLSISLLESGPSRFVIAMVEELSEKRAAQDNLLEPEANLENLGGRLIRAQDEERTRIARELHDHIHQQLALLSVSLDFLQHNLPESVAEISQELGEARKRLEYICKDIHDLSHRLHVSKLEYLGVAAAATSFCKELSYRQKIEIDFRCDGVPRELPKDISLCLYRVLQEALHNAIKHSGVRHFEVELRGASDGIHLTVRDAGLGFDAKTVMNRRGLGLVSMQERVNLVKGTFSIESGPNGGTTIRARVPLSLDGHSMSMAG